MTDETNTLPTSTIFVPLQRIPEGASVGLRTPVVSGVGNDGTSMELAIAPGAGQPGLLLTLTLTEGETIQEVIAVADLIGLWAQDIARRQNKQADEEETARNRAALLEGLN